MTKHRTMLVAAVLFAAGTTSAQACDRHIYNNSNAPWTVRAVPDQFNNEQNYGNVWFADIPCDNAQNGPCTIAPKAIVTITYTTLQANAVGEIFIKDQNGVEKGFAYAGTFECPSIGHVGNTGAVALNDPADGDINMWGPDIW